MHMPCALPTHDVTRYNITFIDRSTELSIFLRQVQEEIFAFFLY